MTDGLESKSTVTQTVVPSLVPLAAAGPTELRELREDLLDALAADSDTSVARLAVRLARRDPQPCRQALVVRDGAELIEALSEEDGPAVIRAREPDRTVPQEVALLLPGVGDHHRRMATGLYPAFPGFRRHFDHCAELIAARTGDDPRGRLDFTAEPPPEAGGDFAVMLAGGRAAGDFDDPTVAQLSVFAVEYALTALLREFGVTPSALLGYSLGEYVAACVAGVFGLEETIAVLTERAELIEATEPGAMLAVLLGHEALAARVSAMDDPRLSVAAVDGPSLCVASGPAAVVEQLAESLTADRVASRRLPVRHGFHSPLLAPAAPRLAEAIAGLSPAPPRLPVLSNVTGTWLTAEQAASPRYWARHLCETVRFDLGLAQAWRRPGTILLEAGPGTALTTLANQHPDRPPAGVAVAAMPGGARFASEAETLLRALGTIWVNNGPVDVAAVAAAGTAGPQGPSATPVSRAMIER